MKIVVLDGYTLNPGDNPWDPLAALGDLTVYDRTNPEDVLERSRGAEILITNKTRLNADTLAALPDLRCIGVIATGYDVVDIAAAGKRGIPVMNVVNYGTEAVAQHAFALLLELCRRTALHDAGIRSGRWAAGPDWCFWDTPQVELSGKVMGILGFGTIGRRVAELAHAFGMKVIAASARKSAAELSASSAPVSFPVEFVEMDELFRASDVLSLHCPLTDQTRAIVNAANSGMTGCYVPGHRCIDNCIHTFAGVQLRSACARLMAQQGHEEPTGQAKLTPAFNLPCRHVLHTVGPIVTGRVTARDRALLASCYCACLTKAAEAGLESIAFCCISTGVFCFPNEDAAEIAVQTVKEFLQTPTTIKKVIFNVFKDLDKEIYTRLLTA